MFGLAISVGGIVLILRTTVDTVGDIVTGIFWFSVSFIIIIVIWLNYTKAIALVDIETPSEMFLNVALLLLVSIEPFLLNVIAFTTAPDVLEFAATAYALDIGALLLLQGVFQHMIMRGLEATGSSHSIIAQKHRRDIAVVDSAIFFASALPVFWIQITPYIYFRYVLWAMAILPAIVVRIHNIRAHEELG